jgi:hypothetical protein
VTDTLLNGGNPRTQVSSSVPPWFNKFFYHKGTESRDFDRASIAHPTDTKLFIDISMKNAIALRFRLSISYYTTLFCLCSVLVTACGKSSSVGINSANNSTTTTSPANNIPIGIAFAQTSNVALLGQEGTDE